MLTSKLSLQEALDHLTDLEKLLHPVDGRYFMVLSRDLLGRTPESFNPVRDVNASMVCRARTYGYEQWPLRTVVLEGGDILLVRFGKPRATTYETYVDRYFDLPLHRSGDAATTFRCATCEGGGCPDCTDPA